MKLLKIESLKLVVLSAMISTGGITTAAAQGTAFTYQGRLYDGAVPVFGTYVVQFTLYDSPTNGNIVGGPIPKTFEFYTNAPSSDNGLFSTILDFGLNPFGSGSPLWLQIAIIDNNGVTNLVDLSPRQPITPVPYSLISGGISGPINGNTILDGTIAGSKLGSNSAVTGINGLSGDISFLSDTNIYISLIRNGSTNAILFSVPGGGGGVGAPGTNAWLLAGNAKTQAGANFLGTTDNQPLEMRVNGQRALRLEPAVFAPNVIGGSELNSAAGSGGATIGGGYANSITNGHSSTIGGGVGNQVGAQSSVIAGGAGNVISSNANTGFIGGGNNNKISGGSYPAIGGGAYNILGSDYATIGGGNINSIGTNSYSATIAGGWGTSIADSMNYSSIGGGFYNSILNTSGTGSGSGYGATIAGGEWNQILGNTDATISGGTMNTNGSREGTIGGGSQNMISSSSEAASIGGGLLNTIASNAGASTIAGGSQNKIASGAVGSSIVGGDLNVVSGTGAYATIAGGFANTAAGNSAFAAGKLAEALHDNTFVWSDGSLAFASTGINQFLINASHGVGINKNNPNSQYSLDVHGDIYSDAAVLAQNLFASNTISGQFISAQFSVSAPQLYGQLNSGSDRNIKEHFEAVEPLDILERVTSLPITSWNFKTEPDVRHIGPMAQDFKAAFEVGIDDKHIGVVDAQGVALAAIQGLNQKIVELQAELKRREAEGAELKTRLEALEQFIQQQHR
jgi:hypothetical protein